MLDWFHVIVLSVVQGITEFLPVSSSAHLILVPALLGWKDQGLAFDIAVHVGTLVAVISYFRSDIMSMGVDFLNALKGYKAFQQSFQINKPARLLYMIAFATIPVGLVGLLSRQFVENHLRSPMIIAFTTIGFGFVLWFSDKWGKQNRSFESLNWRDAMVIGFSEVLSLIPGTSRSGITLTAGLLNGLTCEAAARFSFLLSIPVIILAGGLEWVKLIKSDVLVDWGSLGLGVGLSALSGYFCIYYFLKLLNKVGLFPFILYRLCLGVFLFYYYY